MGSGFGVRGSEEERHSVRSLKPEPKTQNPEPCFFPLTVRWARRCVFVLVSMPVFVLVMRQA
jgi:hypothetical protein